jgi:hypothetical protein
LPQICADGDRFKTIGPRINPINTNLNSRRKTFGLEEAKPKAKLIFEAQSSSTRDGEKVNGGVVMGASSEFLQLHFRTGSLTRHHPGLPG